MGNESQPRGNINSRVKCITCKSMVPSDAEVCPSCGVTFGCGVSPNQPVEVQSDNEEVAAAQTHVKKVKLAIPKHYDNVHIAHIDIDIRRYKPTSKITCVSFKDWSSRGVMPTYLMCISPEHKDPFKNHRCLDKIFLNRWYLTHDNVDQLDTAMWDSADLPTYNTLTLQRLIGDRDQIVCAVEDSSITDVVVVEEPSLDSMIKKYVLKNNLDSITLLEKEQTLLYHIHEDGWALFDAREHKSEINNLLANALIDCKYIHTKSGAAYDAFLKLTEKGAAIRKYITEARYIPDNSRNIGERISALRETIENIGSDSRLDELKTAIKSIGD